MVGGIISDMRRGIIENGASVAERNTQGKLAGELAASRRIARAIAGLHGEATEEVLLTCFASYSSSDMCVVEKERDEEQIMEPASAEGGSKDDGEFFDATTLYGLKFSSQDELEVQ